MGHFKQKEIERCEILEELIIQTARLVKHTVEDTSKVGYLACPYTAKGMAGRERVRLEHKRFVQITDIAGQLTQKYNCPLICPITTSHMLAERMKILGTPLGTEWGSWETIDTAFLHKSDYILVATMEGYKESVGLAAEVELASKLGLPVLTIHPESLEFGGF